MSGRSAYVRARTGELADKTARQQDPPYDHDGTYPYGFPEHPAAPPVLPINQSFGSTPHAPRHRPSVSSGSSTYAYPPPPPSRKPRPIVVASAIEKSDFRTHFDGMSRSVRGKLGRLIKGSDDVANTHTHVSKAGSGSSESGSRSTGVAPSLTAVPALSRCPTPPEGPGPFRIHGPSCQNDLRLKEQEPKVSSIRRFEGGGKMPQTGWRSIASNPELWDDDGDTLVFMYVRGSTSKPPPSFRINSSVIYESGSALFISQLRDTSVPEGWPRFCPSDLPSPVDSQSARDTVTSDDFPHHPLSRSVSASDIGVAEHLHPLGLSKRQLGKSPEGVRHEIYVAWPGPECGLHSTVWHIATRNFFAVLYNANNVVGITLYESLARLFERINTYSDYLDKNTNKAAWITDYMVRHQFDDVRNNPSFAASVLAFSELPGVRWRQGYIEAFVHCVGMLNMGLQTVPEWHYITPLTRVFLQNASLELEDRIHRAQAWLFSFNFTDMWPVSSPPRSSAQSCFDRFRKWLCRHYEGVFLHWPPGNYQTWLTHDMVIRLRNDFHALYDYLVDRDIIFDGSEYRPGQKWAIASKVGQSFRADTPELPLTEILLRFDDRNGFPHMPHPYPITPPSVPAHPKPKSSFISKRSVFHGETLAQSRRKALSYSEASNVYTLRDQYMHTDLVTNFIKFEQSDMLDYVDPFEARRGRWILIYGVLQVLATISVDHPGLRFSDGVQYHISPQMKGVVPWAEPGSPPEPEAEHKKSHCFVVPSTWAPTAPKARPGTHKPILWGQYGDGRIRVESNEKVSYTYTQTPEKIFEKTPEKACEKEHGSIHERAPEVSVTTSMNSHARDISIGRKRAEEWVASTAGEPLEVGFETERSGSPAVPPSSDINEGEVLSGNNEDQSSDPIALSAKRRRAQMLGFSNFQAPKDW